MPSSQVQAVPFDASGAEPIRYLHEVTPMASLAVPMTLNESEVIEDGSEFVMETVGAVVSPPPTSCSG